MRVFCFNSLAQILFYLCGMLRIFLGNQIGGLLLLPFIVAAYTVLNSYTQYFEMSEMITFDLGLWGSVMLDVEIGRFIAPAIVLLNAFLLNFLFNRNSFYDKNSYITSLIYVVLMSFYHSFYQLDGVLVAHSLIILAFFSFFRLQNNEEARKEAFNIGFLIGTAASFHPVLVFTLPLIWITFTRIRPFVFRELWLLTIGFVVPLIYGFSVVFWLKHSINWNFIESATNYEQKQLIFFISIGLFTLSALLSIIGIRIKNQKSSIRFRKMTAMLLLLLITGIGLGVMEMVFLKQYEWFSFSMISLALILPFSFLYKSSNFFATLLFYLIFLFSLAKFFI